MTRTSDSEFLDHAIWIAEEVIDDTMDDDPQRADRLNNLGSYLYERFKVTDSRNDLGKSMAHYQTALHHVASATISRINAGRGLLKCCAAVLDWPQAYQAAATAIQMIPRLTSKLPLNRDRQDTLSQLAGLASDAAAVALHAGEGEVAALRCLEQGRSLLQTFLDRTESEVLQLKSSHPELAEEFIRLRDGLEATTAQVTDLKIQTTQRRASDDELDALVQKIRQQIGFEGFLRETSELEFREAAADGPLIVINPSEYGLHAVLIEEHRIRSMALPSTSMSELMERIESDDLDSQNSLEWLWKAVTEPILNFLDIREATGNDCDLPRVWWIPMGVMSIVPLHAAGRHFPGSTDTVLDRVVSSYSSSIKMLSFSRRRAVTRPSSPPVREKALLVAMAQTRGYSALRSASQEISVLRDLCKQMDLVPIEPRPQKREVLSHLSDCKIFHFAGHGYTDDHDPSQSSLLLEDLPLSLATLQETNLRERAPFMAYLSACGTGLVRHERFFDESLHLISGYQMAGFRHVVGTLWRVDDEISAEMAILTYEGLRDGKLADSSVCRGLHRATREMRNRWLRKHTMQYGAKRDMTEISRAAKRHDSSTPARDGNQEQPLLSRTIVADDSEDEEELQVYNTAPVKWVPYVHYGV
ncbi:hypothetical protein SLS53_003571 [Cytospora paraplurivora]|uniref:CHAT domain-containing protein n=1 Tax=Cytospora paraplurivora TaxID=2898453 RepID=A0AAN9U9C3_9PEZI